MLLIIVDRPFVKGIEWDLTKLSLVVQLISPKVYTILNFLFCLLLEKTGVATLGQHDLRLID